MQSKFNAKIKGKRNTFCQVFGARGIKDDSKGRQKGEVESLKHLQAWLHGCATWAQKGPILGLMLCLVVLEFLIHFEQEAPHFHFALGSTNRVAGMGLMR